MRFAVLLFNFNILTWFFSATFLRKGVVGSYKQELSNDFLKKIDAWEQSYLETEGLSLDDILWSN